MAALIASGPPQRLGLGRGSRISFLEAPKSGGAWVGQRVMSVDNEAAFTLTYWCGTCPIFFRREAGAPETLSIDALTATLNQGLDEIDPDVVTAFSALLPEGSYQPLLIEIEPRLVRPGLSGDYFTEELLRTWDPEPEDTGAGTEYYRTFETRVSDDAHFYEFIIPMVPPSWNEPGRVTAFRDTLGERDPATAVAVSLLDIAAPAVDEGEDYYAHWTLNHFLLDGHHKLEAAAREGRGIRLLTLLAHDFSLADAHQLAKVERLRRSPRLAR